MATDLDVLKELIEDAQEIWKVWLESGFDWEKTLTVDFKFYSGNKAIAEKFCTCLREQSFEVVMNTKRTLIFLKGYEITASIKKTWTLQELQTVIKHLGSLTMEFDLLMEGYGALIKQD